ncbi:hypothetical protein [Gluconobacter oxydans]|uniref:hypothetical protein n=1 Tax=Gluconobacter oxydans TaxID=442 RepID=UPI00346483B8
MPDENVFDLPQPVDREAPFQLLVLQRLDQIGETLAQIHQMEGSKNLLVLRPTL